MAARGAEEEHYSRHIEATAGGSTLLPPFVIHQVRSWRQGRQNGIAIGI
jgi:hypothetical protein